MLSRVNNIRKKLRLPAIILTALSAAIISFGCGETPAPSEATPETTSPPAEGFSYTETKIPLSTFEKNEYIGGILLNELEQPTMYTFQKKEEDSVKATYYVNVLQEDGTWKKEKTEWNDNLRRMASKVGSTIFDIKMGSDGTTYLWLSKREPVKEDDEEINLSYHLIAVSPNGHVEELKNEGLGKDMESCMINRLNGFHIINNKSGIFAEENWSLYDLETGKKKLMYDGIRIMKDDVGELVYARSFVMGDSFYAIADDNCDKLNVFDITSGTLKDTISCDSITPNSETFFIPDEEENAFYTVNKRGIHRIDIKTGSDELVISNNNELVNEDYKVEGAFVTTGEEQQQFYIWYSNINRESDDYGEQYLYQYTLNG